MALLELLLVDDAVDGPYYAGAFHFVDGADEDEEYSYDANGNMTSDLNKNITQIDYNCLNLPTMIRFGDGSKYMSMKYDAAGRLLRRTTRVPFRDIAVSGKLQQERAKVDLAALSSRFVARNGAAASAKSTAGASSASSSASSSAPATTSQGASSSASSSGVRAAALSGNAFGMTDYDYCGNVEYTNDKAVLYHSEGYVTFDKNKQPEFHYYLKDHLGNIRVVVNERDSVEQVTHYYPFGGSFGDGVGSSVQDYLYSGKELTRFNALNWYNYGARWYDPTTLRWNGVDKLAEKYTTVSPYTFCLDNPVRYIDPDGNNPIFSTSGQFLGCTKEGYTGMIYVYTNSDDEYKHFEEHEISYYTNDDSEYVTYFMTYDQAENAFSEYGMPENSRSKFISNVINHLAKHFEGTIINGETFNLSSVQGGRIDYEADNGAYFSTYTYSNGDKPQIVARGRTNNEFEGTVENLASCLLVHEWYGHGIKGIRENNHSLAYKYQMQDPIFYPKTTKSFKKFVKMGYEKYKY